MKLLEQQIMLAVLRLSTDAYGVSIQDEIKKRTKRLWPLGSIYAALDRLERNGFVKSREGEPTPERGGRRKLLFSVTGLGQRALNGSLAELDALRSGLDLVGASA